MEKYELIELIEDRLISNFLLKKKKIGSNDEYYYSIRLSDIKNLGLSYEDNVFVINYLGERDIRVSSMESSEYDSCDNVDIVRKDYIKRNQPINNCNIEENIKKYQKTKDRDLLNKILIDNMELVYYTYWKGHYNSSGLDKNELIQDGLIGLMSAIKNFDFEKGISFSTYAYRSISLEMLSTILKSNGLHRNEYKLFTIIKDLEADAMCYDKQVIVDKAVDILCSKDKLTQKRDSKKLKMRLSVEKYSDSLDELFETDDDYCNDGHVHRVFNDYRNDSFDEYAYHDAEINDKELRNFFGDIFEKLNPSYVYVLKERYGWDKTPRTHRDIAKSMNVSKQCIFDKEARILRKVKKNYGEQLSKFR
jgi:RNA polymerase sigma factor (sigma-70 family)